MSSTRTRRWVSVGASAAAVLLAATACSSGSSSTATSATPSDSSASSTASSSSTGAANGATLTMDQLYAGTYAQPPTTSPAGAKGKSVWWISCSQAVVSCSEPAAAAAAAAKILGIDFHVADGKFNVGGAFTTAVRTALAAKPDALGTFLRMAARRAPTRRSRRRRRCASPPNWAARNLSWCRWSRVPTGCSLTRRAKARGPSPPSRRPTAFCASKRWPIICQPGHMRM